MSKTAKSFRLSEQAIGQLDVLHRKTGVNETAIVEVALALFHRSIVEGISLARTFGGALKRELGEAPNVHDENEAMEQAEVEELLRKFPMLWDASKVQITFPHKKKRKRR